MASPDRGEASRITDGAPAAAAAAERGSHSGTRSSTCTPTATAAAGTGESEHPDLTGFGDVTAERGSCAAAPQPDMRLGGPNPIAIPHRGASVEVATGDDAAAVPRHREGAAGGGGGSARRSGGVRQAAATVAGVSAAVAEVRLAVRAHFDGLVADMQRLRAANERLSEKCEAQAEHAAAVAMFAKDAAAAASRADSEDEEELLRALQGLRVTLGEVEAELDSLEAQRDHSSRR